MVDRAIAPDPEHRSTTRTGVEVRALELSPDAYAWAVANRDRLGLDVDLVQGDATLACFEDWPGPLDVVTGNPPYIPVAAVPVDPEVRDHDPDLALYGGSADGLSIPLAVAARAAAPLKPGGVPGVGRAAPRGQSRPAARARPCVGRDVAAHEDLTGRRRATVAVRAWAARAQVGRPPLGGPCRSGPRGNG